MNFPTTLVEGLEQAKSDVKKLTFVHGFDSETEISYLELYQQALRRLHYLQQKGVPDNSHIIIYTNDLQEFLVSFWACILGGIVAVPVAVGISDEHRIKLIRIFNKLENPWIISNSKSEDLLKSFLQRQDKAQDHLLERILPLEQMPVDGEMASPVAAEPEHTAFIQFSSGSTREPKGIILTHANLIANVHSAGTRNEFCEKDVFLSWMPLTHDMGLIGFHLYPLLHKSPHTLIPTDLFSRRPLIWLRKASEHGATVINSPNFGYKHYLKVFNNKPDQSLDLSTIRIIYNGAEPISLELCEQFVDTMCHYKLNKKAMMPVYGLAEATLAVSMPPPLQGINYVCVDRHKLKIGDTVQFCERGAEDSLALVTEGPAIDTCEIKITDLDNRQLAQNQVGEIQIKGATVTGGFYRDEAASKTAFTGDHWLNTGDTGFMHGQDLVVSGRTKDIIFVNGQNYFPHDLETIALEADPYLELGKIAAYGLNQDVAPDSELIFFVVFRNEPNLFVPLSKNIIRHVNEATGLQVSHVIPVQRIPKTTSGKTQRHLLGKLYMEGEYKEILNQLQELAQPVQQAPEAAQDDSTESRLLALCKTCIEGKTVGLDDNLFEIGISSLALSQLHEQLDAQYPGLLEITDFFELPTLAQIATYIDSKKA